MKKWVAFLVIIAMFALSACSGSSTSQGSSKSNKSSAGGSSSSSSNSSSNGKVTLNFFQPGLDQPGQKKPVQDMVNAFEKKYPNIKVNIQTVGWDQAYQKLVTGFSAGTSPDVIYGGTRWVGAFAKMNGVMSLNKYAKDHIKLYSKALQDAETINGNIYAIPRAFSARTLIYRSDLIKNPPKTWNQLVSVAKKVQQQNPGMYGFAIAGAKHVSTTTQLFNYIFQNGGKIFDSKGNPVLNSKADVEALQFYKDLYVKDKIVPNPIEYNREQLPVLFKEGKIAMFVCGPWAQAIMGVKPDNSKTPYKTAMLPKGKVLSNTLVSDSMMISAKTKHPDAAWKFLNFATSPKWQFNYDKTQGSLPVQKAEAEKSFFSQDPYFKTFVEMSKHGIAQPVPAAWEPFQNIITDAVQKSFNGGDPQKIMNDANQKIKDQKLQPK